MPDDPTPDTGKETPPDTQPDTDPAGEPEGGEKDPTPDPSELQAELNKWKTQAKKHEREWKKFSQELDEVRQAQMSEQEKAIAQATSEAEARGRQAALGDIGQRLAGAEIKAALTGVVPDPTAIVEDLNLAKYVTDDGDVDEDAVKALAKKYQALAPKDAKPPAGQRPKPNLQTVPVANGDAPKTDMNEWMRSKASSE